MLSQTLLNFTKKDKYTVSNTISKTNDLNSAELLEI